MPATPLSSMLRRLAACAALGCGAALAQVDETALKAAIVYNLLLFAEWPIDAAPPAGGALVVCVDPASTLAPPLRSLQGRAVRNHRLDVRDVPLDDSVRWRCHALVQDATSRAPAAVRRTLGNAPVLVVSDEPRVDDGGVVVQLALAGGRVVFDVDLRAARRNGLQLSSKLLRLAREVRE